MTPQPLFFRAGLVLLSLLPLAVAGSAAAESPAPASLQGLRVALDVGHSLQNQGAGSARGVGEFHFNQATARVVRDILTSAGAHVVMINENGDLPDLLRRTDLALEKQCDVFLSIHHDSCHQKYKQKWLVDGAPQEYADQFSGFGVFCSQKHPQAQLSRQYATILGHAMLAAGFHPALHHHEAIEGENRPFIDEAAGVYEYSDLIVVKRTAMPAALLECGVIVNRDEELRVKTREYQEQLAKAVAQAFAECLSQGVLQPGSGARLSPTPRGGPVAPVSPPEDKKGLLRRLFERPQKP